VYREDEGLLVTGANDAMLKVWRLPADGDQLVCLSTVKAHAAPVYSLAVLGSLLVSASYDGSIKVRAGPHGAVATVTG
jgi:WD40 repeat protein